MTGNTGNNAYRIGAAVAVVAGLLQIWMNLAVGIVGNEDNPANLGFYLVVVTALACSFTAAFRTEGMARAMIATAGVQALLGLFVSTAPSNAAEAMGVLGLSGGFTALWLIAAACFHRGGRSDARHAMA
ncbi:MAG: hypothetical protein ACAH11_14200 [Sphingomonas sp.]